MERPLVGLSTIIQNHLGQILLGKRINTKGEGLWATPGGHLELNETWEKCTKREVMEETNLEIKNFNFIDVFNVIEHHHHYIEIYTISELAGGKLKNMEPDKCESWHWFDLNNLPTPLYSTLYYVLPRLIHMCVLTTVRQTINEIATENYPHNIIDNQFILKGQ